MRYKNPFIFVMVCGIVCYLFIDNISQRIYDYQFIQVKEEIDDYYVVDTPGCQMINYSIHDPSVEHFIPKTPTKINCSSTRPLTYTKRQSLILNLTYLEDYNLNGSEILCYYQGIYRVSTDEMEFKGPCDKTSRLMPPVELNVRETPLTEEGVFVYCNSQMKGSTISNKMDKSTFYKNVHYFIQPIKARRKMDQFDKDSARKFNRNKLNVIMLGIDSTSRLNLMRSLPDTYKYITEELDTIIFNGYNKVKVNSFVNLMPILTGTAKEDMESINCPDKTKKFDKCPLIWNEFSENGYITIYNEDALWMGLFRYGFRGFWKPPTDFYQSSSFVISENRIGHSAGHKLNGKICQGSKLSHEVLYDYLFSATQELKGYPFFSYTFAAAITHDSLKLSSAADKGTLDLLKKLKDNGTFENTIMVFFSDHGFRYGDIRRTHTGFVEERTPFMTMIFPKWFKYKQPKTWTNLILNQHRLTCNYDIYHTLKDIVGQNFDLQVSDVKHHKHVKYGQSLFKEVSKYRTCLDCGILPHFCVCEKPIEIPKNDQIYNVYAQKIVDYINKKLKSFKKCVKLSLIKVISVFGNEFVIGKKNIYFVTFKTNPGAALFEGSIIVSSENKTTVAGEVGRLNMYGNQSHCINHEVFRKFCFCQDLLDKALTLHPLESTNSIKINPLVNYSSKPGKPLKYKKSLESDTPLKSGKLLKSQNL